MTDHGDWIQKRCKMEKQKSPEDEYLQQKTSQLKKWLEDKPHVPKNIDEKLYRRFIHSCYYDLDKAKSAADMFFSIRATSPELLTDRDPLSPHMQKTLKITNMARYRLSKNRNLWVWQLDDPGLQQYDHQLEAKLFILTADAWLLDDEFLEEEDIVVTDAKDISLKVLTKFSYSVGKKLSKYQQEAVPLRIKQIHIVNAPSVINRVFAILKPFIGKETLDMIHVHTPKSKTIFEYFRRDELPEEFGGTRGKMSDHVAEATAALMKHREHLIDENFWRVDPTTSKKEKTQSKPVSKVTTEINSMRTLAID